MPRGPPNGSFPKRQNHHNEMKRPSLSGSAINTTTTTTNGLAVPTTTTTTTAASTPTLTQTLNQQIPPAASQFHPVSANAPQRPCVNGYARGWDGHRSERGYEDSGEDFGAEAFADGPDHGTVASAEHGKIDFGTGEEITMARIPPSTVLPSFPLLDTIMLLILFLQLPPTVLTIIHFLFASLTFVPPSTTLLSVSSASALPPMSILLLQGSNGAPSLLTIIFADILVALLSIFLWPSARNFLIDFAQAVIAMTLGAGYQSETLWNAAVCAGVMGSVKMVQARFRLANAWDGVVPTTTALYYGEPNGASTGIMSSAGWVRSAIAIHIVAQGAMRAARRRLMRPHSGDPSAPGSSAGAKDAPLTSGKQKDKDPEAAAGVSTQSLEPQNSTGGGKRKKKNQIQNIRNNQPLWATIASTMVHVAKEVEQSKLSSAASNPNSLETGTISNEPSPDGEDVRVWITKIGSTDIAFGAGFLGMGIDDEGGYEMRGAALTNGVDGSGKDGTFPLFVRVNAIVWPQTAISKYIPGGDRDRENGVIIGDVEEEWMIDITGLTGATEYDFEFVKKDGKIVYRTSACTTPAQASSAAPPVTKQPSRPLSPITTLLHSLSQANSCLTEKKNRLKAVRKNQKSALSDIRKETEKNKSLLGNDRGDERAFRRILALKESIKRADEETEKMTKELEGLQNLPEKLKAEWKAKKRSWREERDRLLSAQSQAGEVKEAADRQISAVESEAASFAQKKEKLTARLGKLRADLEKLEKERQQNIESHQRREAEREKLEKHRLSLEKEFSDAILRMEQKMVDYRMYSAENWAAFYAYESSLQSQLPPSTPDTGGGLPGTNSNRNSLHISSPPGLMLYQGSYAASSTSLPIGSTTYRTTHERSSSTFSSGSVMTNMSEMERSEMIRASTSSSFPHANSLGHMTSFFPSIMGGGPGPALVGGLGLSDRKEN